MKRKVLSGIFGVVMSVVMLSAMMVITPVAQARTFTLAGDTFESFTSGLTHSQFINSAYSDDTGYRSDGWGTRWGNTNTRWNPTSNGGVAFSVEDDGSGSNKVLKVQRNVFRKSFTYNNTAYSNCLYSTTSQEWIGTSTEPDSGARVIRKLEKNFTSGELNTSFKVKFNGGAKQMVSVGFNGLTSSTGYDLVRISKTNIASTFTHAFKGGNSYSFGKTLKDNVWHTVNISLDITDELVPTVTISVLGEYTDGTEAAVSHTWTKHSDYNVTVCNIDAIYFKSERGDDIADATSGTTYTSSIWYIDDLNVTTDYEVDKLDITEVTGALKFFGQNFDDTSVSDGDRISTELGFTNVNDTNKNAQYYVRYDEITDVPETSNRVLDAKEYITMARSTSDIFAKLQASEKTYNVGTTAYKLIDFTANYYIGGIGSKVGEKIYWFRKSVVDAGTAISSVDNTNCGQWFYINSDGTPREGGVNSSTASGSSFYMPGCEMPADEIAYQFDFAYESNGDIYSDDAINLYVDGAEFCMTQSGGIYTYGTFSLDRGDATSTLKTGSGNGIMVPAYSADIPYYLSSSEYSGHLASAAPMYNDMQWHTVMVRFDTVDNTFTIYYDGMPVYYKDSSNNYSCKIKRSKTTTPTFGVGLNRGSLYANHVPVFDNFLGYAVLKGTDQEIAQYVVDSVTMPYIDADIITNDILFDEDESKLVEWSFSNNTFVIDESNPLIARYNAPYGWGTSTVTLTASYTYNEAVATKDFVLTVQDKPKYTINTVLMKDAEGNRIYRPLDNSVIESVSYTANSGETATMYLAVYESDGRMINAKKGTLANGKVTFNQQINADETYKVFIWEDSTLTKLAELKTNDYIESETPTIFNIGDSMAQSYGESNPLKGWGEYLYKAFNDNVKVENKNSVGGRTTKYALTEDRLKDVILKGVAGDYLFIMLGHNDQKLHEYYGATIEEYSILLTQMINAAKSKGMIPVILTPLARPSWENGIAKDTHGNYPEAAIAVAEATGAAVIDIDSLSRAELTRIGSEGTTAAGYYYPGDSHTTAAGADWVVGMIADELAKMNLPISEFLTE